MATKSFLVKMEELAELVEMAEGGDGSAAEEASAIAVTLLRGKKLYNDGLGTHLACKAIALAGKNGYACPHDMLVSCLTNKVARNWHEREAISNEAMEGALSDISCVEFDCANHLRYEAFSTPIEIEPFGNGFIKPDEYVDVKDR